MIINMYKYFFFILYVELEKLSFNGMRIGYSGGLEIRNFQYYTKLSNSLLLSSKLIKVIENYKKISTSKIRSGNHCIVVRCDYLLTCFTQFMLCDGNI